MIPPNHVVYGDRPRCSKVLGDRKLAFRLPITAGLGLLAAVHGVDHERRNELARSIQGGRPV